MNVKRVSPLIAGLAVYWLLSMLWYVFRWGGPEHKALIGDVIFLPLGLLVGAAIWWSASAPGVEPEARRAWRYFALASWSIGLGNWLWYYYEHIVGVYPFPSGADVLYMLCYPFMFAGLWGLKGGRFSKAERFTFTLDSGVVLVAGSMISWYVIIGPTLAMQGDLVSTVLALAYPLGDIVLLFGLSTLILKGQAGSHRPGLRTLVLAMLFYVVADTGYAHGFTAGTYESGDAVDLISMTGHMLMATAAWVYARGAATGGTRERRAGQERSTTISPLPYAAALVAAILLLVAESSEGYDDVLVLVVGTFVVIVLVIVRQFSAMRENQRLLGETRVMAARVERTGARFQSLFQNSSDVVMVISPKGAIRYQSPSVQRIFGYEPGELRGTHYTTLVHPDDLESLLQARQNAFRKSKVECRVRDRNGAWRWTEAVISDFVPDAGVRGLVINIRDVTERKSLEEQLRRLAYHDPLTGLANRAQFHRLVSAALNQGDGRPPVAVLFLDLNGFKTVNDSFGHHVGDELLKWLGARIEQAVAGDGVVARLGGDEFAVVVENTAVMLPEGVAERIVRAMTEPFQLGERQIHCRVSIGIATSHGPGSVDDLLRDADTAMYAAKAERKGGYMVYTPEMHASALDRVELEADLRAAVSREELLLHYQPIMDLRKGRISGVEALLRWPHPVRGMIAPDEFIPVAEETGLMQPITQWVIRQACFRLAAWHREHPDLAGLTMSVNLSAVDLRRAEIVADVAAILEEAGVRPESLTLEITESLLLERTEAVAQRLQSLRKLGVRLAIDDFGTGYSSLSYLKDFPVDLIKIDRSFIRELSAGSAEATMVRGILEITRALKLRTVAEGVEDPVQVEALTGLPCDFGQGYYFARPVAAEQVTPLLLGMARAGA
ncbi:MAG TPA: EAL domain-containing protein [Symbiobacteriaceae bacterium]|nr:EAL domain-containing protein [Symbiobacteriaceae bacterium]